MAVLLSLLAFFLSPPQAAFFSLAQHDHHSIKLSDAKRDILHTIFNQYSPITRPCNSGEQSQPDQCLPVVVNVSCYVRSVEMFDETKRTFAADITLRRSWRDQRLAYDYIAGAALFPDHLSMYNDHRASRIWLPDAYFVSEIQSSKLDMGKAHSSLRLYPDGRLDNSVRIRSFFRCEGNLHNYPSSRYACNVDISSYVFTTDDLVIHWKESGAVIFSSTLSSAEHSDFTVADIRRSNCTHQTESKETYSCIRLSFIIHRHSHGFLGITFRHFLPPAVLFLIVTLAYWLPKHHFALQTLLTFICLIIFLLQACFTVDSTVLTNFGALHVWMLAHLVVLVSDAVLLILYARSVSRLSNYVAPTLAKKQNYTFDEDLDQLSVHTVVAKGRNIHWRLLRTILPTMYFVFVFGFWLIFMTS